MSNCTIYSTREHHRSTAKGKLPGCLSAGLTDFVQRLAPHGCAIIPSSPRGSHCAAIHLGTLIKQNFRESQRVGMVLGWADGAPCSIKARIQMSFTRTYLRTRSSNNEMKNSNLHIRKKGRRNRSRKMFLSY